jgi:hypothetical protein
LVAQLKISIVSEFGHIPVESRRIGAVDIVPPVAGKLLLIEQSAIGAQESGALVTFAPIMANMVGLKSHNGPKYNFHHKQRPQQQKNNRDRLRQHLIWPKHEPTPRSERLIEPSMNVAQLREPRMRVIASFSSLLAVPLPQYIDLNHVVSYCYINTRHAGEQ